MTGVEMPEAMEFALDFPQQAAGVVDIRHNLGSDDYIVTCLGPDRGPVGYTLATPAPDDVTVVFEPYTVAVVVLTLQLPSGADSQPTGSDDTFAQR